MRWLRWLHHTAQKGFIVGDDAFSSIHERMLTPFNKRQLHKQSACVELALVELEVL